MDNRGKLGSSRRKGDDFQDLASMRLALEYYIEQKPFEMYLEYEKSGNLDDIVIFSNSNILAYQVKYAVNPHDIYSEDDLLKPNSKVFIKKFADSWSALRSRYPDYTLMIHLYSNKGISRSLADLINSDGTFQDGVIHDRRRNEAKNLRADLASASGLKPDEFKLFLECFRFVLLQPDFQLQTNYIKGTLLGDNLGLTGDAIFFDIKDHIKEAAINSRDAITLKHVDGLLDGVKSKLLVPQVFPINREYFVKQSALSESLDATLPKIDGAYLIITGLPGSGKSTSLTMCLDLLDKSIYEVFKYYCFVGVNDNTQKIRAQAKSLRVNLLEAFHKKYPHILKRRYDYSEENFIECLGDMAKFFAEQNRQLIILLDGLDHAERLDSVILETVISAMPPDVPKGIIIIVGTQELHKWPHFLALARERSDSHIEMPMFSESETEDYLKNKRGILDLTQSDILDIQTKSQGLPLYLNYLAEKIISSDEPVANIIAATPIAEGNIRSYYELLWENFERTNLRNARHLCVIMSCVRFGIHRETLYRLSELDRPDFEDALKYISHLLKNVDGRLSVFHDSFRVFVNNKVDAEWIKSAKENICIFLQSQKDDPIWFSYVFEYCYETKNYDYIFNEVNEDFIDRALLHFRPSSEIIDAIHLATEAAHDNKDIVQLGRIGSLLSRTNERLEHNLDQGLLADALLTLGREQDVLTFAYCSESNSLLVDITVCIL